MLAKRFGLSQAAVSEWFALEKGYPKLSVLVEIAHETGMPLDELLLGRMPVRQAAPQIPVLTLAQAQKFDFDKGVLEQKTDPDLLIHAPFGKSEGLVGIIQSGDSMAQPFPHGAIVAIDRHKKNPSNGDLVLARLKDDSLLFRKYAHEGKKYLIPLNPQHENYSGEFSVLGTLSFSIYRS